MKAHILLVRDLVPMRIYDISQSIVPGIPTWPGDTPYSEKRTWHLGRGSVVNVSKIELSTHTGTHADAPFHFNESGEKIGAVDVRRYIGPCIVWDVSHATGNVQPGDLPEFSGGAVERVLLRTMRQADLTRWNAHFTAVAPQTIERLAALGVRLIGVDTPSLDPQSSKEMAAHHAAYMHDILVLEGLALSGVPPGQYELIALPLKFANLDASPVRAILRTLVEHDAH